MGLGDFVGGIFDGISSAFTGGGGGSSSGGGGFGSAWLPALITSGGAYLMNRGNNEIKNDQLEQQRQWQQEDAQQQHQWAVEMAQMQAAQAAAANGANVAAQMAAIKQRAYEAAIQAALQGSQNTVNAYGQLIKGVQGPFSR